MRGTSTRSRSPSTESRIELGSGEAMEIVAFLPSKLSRISPNSERETPFSSVLLFSGLSKEPSVTSKSTAPTIVWGLIKSPNLVSIATIHLLPRQNHPNKKDRDVILPYSHMPPERPQRTKPALKQAPRKNSA